MELTRNLVERFNSRYNDILVKPEIRAKSWWTCNEFTGPTKKMSKSDDNQKLYLITRRTKCCSEKLKAL